MIQFIIAILAPIFKFNSIISSIIQNLYKKSVKGFIITFFITLFGNKFALVATWVFYN
jgi:hypothetical protein